ncbi:hypothetical protein CLV80_102426 [Yoonia maritima]|uniref:Uncharacterized protein n=2 Tax=Yoonia maritima TaxID=1435347 RepID=A0A2T0W3N6_9RHOB|nr:hypothetical protein CLV80_102426 [Yoonia maritima]
MRPAENYLRRIKEDILMRHFYAPPLAVVMAFGVASALHGYAVEPMPGMLAQISPSLLSEITPSLPADVCAMPISPDTDNAETDVLETCHAVQGEAGF